jgi:hypothetical protein
MQKLKFLNVKRMDPTAEELKNEANEVFKNKDYNRALELYSKAIEVDGTSGKFSIYQIKQ